MWPLSCVDGHLTALAHDGSKRAWKVVVVDTMNEPRTLFQSDTLPFPEDAVPGSPGFPFSLLQARDSGQHLWLFWKLPPEADSGAEPQTS